MQCLSFDYETCGVTPDSAVLSLGAALCDLSTGEINKQGFHINFDIDSQQDRRFAHETLRWWMTQASEAKQGSFAEKDKTVNLVQGHLDFFQWLSKQKISKRSVDFGSLLVFSNGADFDIPILQHVCVQNDLTAPWPFWNHRCLRTLRSLYPNVKVEKVGTAHNALADAFNQATLLCAIYKERK